MQFKRKSRPAEAPMDTDDLMTLDDPLDYLAKYCIINPNRLPFYDIIFSTVVSEQSPRFESLSKRSKGDTEVSADHVTSPRDTAAFSRHELEMSRDMAILNRATVNGDVVLSPLEQYLKKIIFTLDGLGRQQKELRKELHAVTEQRTHILASRARKLFPEVASPDFVPKKKKGKKKKAKRDKNVPLAATKGEITDEIIESRLDDAMLAVLRKESDVRQLDASVSRVNDKLTSLAQRMQLLEGERSEVTEQCVEMYVLQQQLADRPLEFRRQQSELYLALHPQPDMEMNVDEVERALQQINNRLLTDKEFLYLYHVLNLPKRERINFRTFSILAALSEKVTQLDPLIRSLINKFDFNALDVKMEKSKELFRLLEDESYCTPRGGASAGSLAVELTAGGLTPEHTRYVLSKFNRESRGIVDFLDFVMYVPLFVEIHQRIISDPLKDDLDL